MKNQEIDKEIKRMNRVLTRLARDYNDHEDRIIKLERKVKSLE